MSRFRVFVLSLWVTCVCFGRVEAEECLGAKGLVRLADKTG
jgi:hypothetical protein